MKKGKDAAPALDLPVAVENADTGEDWRIKLRRSIDIYKPMVVSFVASWCNKCKEINPQFDEISKKHPGMYFVRIDVDMLPDVTAQWGVKSVPTFVFIRGGRQIDVVAGPNKEEVDSKAATYALPPKPSPE
ncbi:thioredoxin H-type [Selaginella moellendorffii]|nr:thioredoxin H-type [Selaginella moellendorffii]|eukprot:XP_002970542.2 thioredoxin H-type [Selaginella moellendorffii]